MRKAQSVLLLILPIIISLSGCRKLPLSRFEVESTNAYVGETITFDNKTLNASTYLWDFGDGETSTTKEVTHKYTSVGTYTVKLTAYSKKGNASSMSNKVITVTKSQAQIDGEASSQLIMKSWSLDSLNLDENNGPTHVNYPVANLWGGTTEYLYIFSSPDVLTTHRDGVQESAHTWVFNSGTELEVDNQVIHNVTTLNGTRFVFSRPSSQDPNYTETWYFTEL